MTFQCPKCKLNVKPNLTETGPNTKATCPECNAYIKMVGKKELAAIVEATLNQADSNTNEKVLTIRTVAPEDYLPDILGRVKKSLERGFTSGEGSVIKPFDDDTYSYDFEYK